MSVYCPVSPSRQKTKVAAMCVPTRASIWTTSTGGADEEKGSPEVRVPAAWMKMWSMLSWEPLIRPHHPELE